MTNANGMTLCVDPGTRSCGCALFFGTALVRAALIADGYEGIQRSDPRTWAAMAVNVFDWARCQLPHRWLEIDVVLERPRIYPGSEQQKGDLNDLVDLAGVIGAIAGEHSDDRIHFYYPSDWKGQVKKAVMTQRILKHLTDAERSRIDRVGAKDHNTIDAVGIGLFRFGRLNKKVIHR